MRNWINVIVEADRSRLLDLTMYVRDSVAPNFAGSCEGAVGDLIDLLTQDGIVASAVEGRYDAPMDWGDGTTHPFTPHWWVETKDFILDPTREQFNNKQLIVSKTDPHYMRGGVGIQESVIWIENPDRPR